ncbi:ATP-dependent DNA helicase RecG [Dokdonella fugitiva]|jgi:ATP-dependent DNA helicase RecG|uniref:ATP-dependent DNA helicase RecG n=1 Tax=Dokdonella fugitiva TaxID=328517 RepID=A0A4R2I3T9_9GAMM|nr:ATP-dependent DNA helicase RecG [Dokdonella fugitiva]MBA8884699.1 ATP-dependent DNA helicase RecG [Dokdonella fugitiva]TCO37718.1 ATP-dependent DNA helicase RecG [Dokdonella fugitiva]
MPSRAARSTVALADSGLAPLTTLPGVGPALAGALGRLGLARVQDLWFHLPLRYEDRTRITPIRELRIGESAQVEGVVEAVERGFRYRPQLRVALVDASQATLTLRFFHFNRAQAEQFAPGARILCYGEVRYGAHGPEIVHPEYRRIAAGMVATAEQALTPVYPSTEGLGQKRLAGVIARALERLPADDVLELIPAELRARLGLDSLRASLLLLHHPPPDADVAALLGGRHPAQQRLAFEELLTHHLSLKRLRAQVRRHGAPPLAGDGRLRRALRANLPYALTRAQERVGAEIERDLARAKPMLRLVQGDVGSGKTVVAALAALAAAEAGAQAALVAPTELLAEQHCNTFRAWLQPLGIEPVWLAGKVTGRARSAALAAVAEGAPLVIGTHALLQEGVAFRNLGLAIIDEQHRFGVHQRLALRDKGRDGDRVPHQLVLTATPIPRTLAMTAYADLDVSVIDELPPGRTPVQTVAISSSRRGEVIERIRAACAEGRQAYWVCTLIEESEQLEAQAAEVAFAELTAALPGLRIGLVHGRLKPKEKQATMDAFKRGDTRLLVATTVIEVGVDVPNASLMVIENAERLGLAQLHQLRGRVGRGSASSSCVLLYRTPLSSTARARLEAMRETADGFRIAEKDLELRGPGELLGTRQTGQLMFRVADLARDAHLLPQVQRIGEAMLRDHAPAAERLVARWIGGAARYAGA